MNARRQASEQRRRILDAAIRVFGEAGWKGATTRMIGREAGVNSALIYYYFADKQTLFREMLQHVLLGFLERLRGADRPLRGARDRIAFLVDTVGDYYGDHPERMRLMAMALTQHQDLLAGALTEFFRSGVELGPLRILADGVRARELRALEPLPVWWSILGLCIFNAQLGGVFDRVDPSVLPGAPPSGQDRRRLTIDLLVRGLAAEGARKAPRKD